MTVYLTVYVYLCMHYDNILVSVAMEDLKEMLDREQEEEQSWRNELQATVGMLIEIS